MRSWTRCRLSSLAASARTVSVPGPACMVHRPQPMSRVPWVSDHSTCWISGRTCARPAWRRVLWLMLLACRQSWMRYRLGWPVWMRASAVGMGLPGGGGGGRGPQDAGYGGGEPPVPPAEDPDERGQQQRADDDGVEEDPRAQGGGEHLDGGVGGGRQGEEGEEEDEGGAGHQPPGPADAADHGLAGGAGGVVFLADAGEDEYLVVHRQPEQEREGQQGHVHGDRPGCRDGPQGVAAVALLPYQHQDPVGHAERGQVEEDRLDGQHQGPERPGQQGEGDQGDQAEHEREAAVDGAGELGVAGALAADTDDARLAGEGVLDG